MRKIALAALLATGTLPVLSGQVPAKKRVAVFDFDNAAVQGGMTLSVFEGAKPPNVGQAASNLLINRLVQGGAVTVIERAAIDKLLAEQNLTNSDRTDPLTAAKLGRILGVDVIVLGSITRHDYNDRTTGGGGGGFGMFGRGSIMSTKHDIQAIVQLSARLVSPDTAEVVAVAQGRGEIVRKGVKVDLRDSARGAEMMGGTANNPIMNEAMDNAIVQLVTELNPAFAKLPARTPVIDGLVADANESGRLILNVGSQNGLKPGDRLQVWRAGKEVRDPATGKVLLRDDTLLGEAVATTVNDISAIATFNGTETPKTGDLVKSLPRQK
jgi:curli biogenesis system outer membrane secretion channel CsgG